MVSETDLGFPESTHVEYCYKLTFEPFNLTFFDHEDDLISIPDILL